MEIGIIGAALGFFVGLAYGLWRAHAWEQHFCMLRDSKGREILMLIEIADRQGKALQKIAQGNAVDSPMAAVYKDYAREGLGLRILEGNSEYEFH